MTRSPAAFIGLVVVLSLPFWVIGATIDRELLPGLPVSALMAFVPPIAVAILAFRDGGWSRVRAQLGRVADWARIRPRWWYAPILLLTPAISVGTYGVMRVMHRALPTPEVPALAGVLVVCVGFLASGLAEELGWSGYATDPLQDRWGPLGAALLLGTVWGAWHIVPLTQAHRGATWIAGWFLGTVANRVIIVWLYDNTHRSVFAAGLYHATLNSCWQLFPNHGSHYDPRVGGIVVAVVAGIITATWGPRGPTHAMAGTRRSRASTRRAPTVV
jgi:membrane protease YdiL (CAAX protease family)